jgi:hypothetical protein
VFAAIPSDESRVLELFDLALRVVREQGRLPQQLSDHFNTVLNQARNLARDPSVVVAGLSPEAIQLARQLRETRGLEEAMLDVADISTITPTVAGSILAKLENHIAP